MYPDMVKPSATGTTDEIPAPGIELPTPKKETDLRSTTPAQNNSKPAAGDTTPSDTSHPSTTDEQPTPAKSTNETKPADVPPQKEAPGATPPSDDLFFTPPNNSQPTPSPPAPGTSSTEPPKTWSHMDGIKPISASNGNDNNAFHKPQPAKTEISDTSIAAQPLRLRINADDFSRPISPDQEPDLIVPSLATKPVPKFDLEATIQKTAPISSGNPLRGDLSRSVVPASLGSADSVRSDTNQVGGIRPSSFTDAATGSSASTAVFNSSPYSNGTSATSASTSTSYSNSAPSSSPAANPLR
jgi:hypothetical protein